MKKTNFCLIRNAIFSGLLFLSGTIQASISDNVTPAVCPNSSEVYASADDKSEVVKYFIVWDNEGGFVSFPLEERPRIISDYQKQEIKCITSKQEVIFEMNEVHKYTLHADPDELMSIENVTEPEGSFHRDLNSFGFENFKPGSRVSVYTVNGMLMHSYNIDNDGKLTISTAGWGAGVYLIKTESVTYKVVRK